MRNKAKKGVYDKVKAIDAWYKVATEASNQYNKEFGYKFNVADRFTAAVDMTDYYEEEALYNL